MKITEALAELKTINKRIQKKEEFVQTYLTRPEGIKDPLATDGGSAAAIEKALQAIGDLRARIIALRRGVQVANDETKLTIGGMTHTISEWLIWRRECAPGETQFVNVLNRAIQHARNEAIRSGNKMVSKESEATGPTDIVVSIDESYLAKDAERLEEVLGNLDGALSLTNATVEVRV